MENKELLINCFIEKNGNCGDHGFGRTEYLVNPNGTQKFRVLVRTTRNYGTPVSEDNVYTVEPWNRVKLGCDQEHGSVPTIIYNRIIISEVAL